MSTQWTICSGAPSLGVQPSDGPALAGRLADALNTLSARLLAHLDVEEKVLGPVLLAMKPGR